MDDVETRAEILLEEANQLLNRLAADISYLGGKITSFFGIIVGVISFQATLVIVLSNIRNFATYSYFFFIFYLILIIWSVVLSFYLLRPCDYKDVKIFSEDRLRTLSSCSRRDLLSDLLHFTRESYINNYEIYNKNWKHLKNLYSIFLVGNIFYILLVISLWIPV